MRLLLVKISSLGDIIHTFPALTDAKHHIPNLQIDWVVEESFQQIPSLHPAVKQVIPIAIRRWRKQMSDFKTWKEIKNAIQSLRQEKYDFIIDAQGLFKSSMVSLLAKGPRYGYNWASAREPISSITNQHKINIPWTLTAIERSRILFAKTLGYAPPTTPIDAGLPIIEERKENELLFLPGTSWTIKKWPLEYWFQLALLLKEKEYKITVPWSTDQELQEALYIQTAGNHVTVLPKMDLRTLTQNIQYYRATVALDSGLGFLSAAFHIPTIILWGPTTPIKVGTFDTYQHNITSHFKCFPCRGKKCHNLHLSSIQPPCFEEITPQLVFDKLMEILK